MGGQGDRGAAGGRVLSPARCNSPPIVSGRHPHRLFFSSVLITTPPAPVNTSGFQPPRERLVEKGYHARDIGTALQNCARNCAPSAATTPHPALPHADAWHSASSPSTLPLLGQSPFPSPSPCPVPVPRPNPDHNDLVPHAPWHESRITSLGMRRRSSGSSQDGDLSPVEAPHVNSLLTPLALDSRASAPTSPSPSSLDRRRSSDKRSGPARSRRSSNVNWKPSELRDASIDSPSRIAHSTSSPALLPANGAPAKEMDKDQESRFIGRRPRLRSPWAITFTTLITSILGIAFLVAVLHSSVTRQLDPKGCRMSYMRPGYARLSDFDTEHTRFASKYSLYLYREQGVEHGTKVPPGIDGVLGRVANLSRRRSRAFPSSSSPATQGATSRSGPSPPRPQTTFTRCCSTTSRR